MSTIETYHAPAGNDLFAPSALCGATADREPDGMLRVHSIGVEVTCATCRDLLLGDGA